MAEVRTRTSRRVTFVALALLLGVLFTYPGSGVVSGWWSTEDGGIHRFHHVVWGMHTGLMLSAGLLALLARTEERVASAQQVGVAMAVMMAVLFGAVVIPHVGEPGTEVDRVVFTILILVLTGVVLALHPRRGELLRSGQGLSRPMAAIGVVGLVVAIPYAIDHIQIQVAADLVTDPHSAGDRTHWDEMASATLTLPLVALVAALRTRGWRLVAWTAGIATMVFGTASMLLAEQASSPGVGWGVLVLVGGALFIAVAEDEARRPNDSRWRPGSASRSNAAARRCSHRAPRQPTGPLLPTGRPGFISRGATEASPSAREDRSAPPERW